MVDLYKMQVTWSGTTGLPGTTTLYSLAIPPVSGVKAMFTSLKAYFPAGLTWTIPASGDVIDETTGILTGAWSSGSALSEVSSGSTAYAGGVGCVIRWTTTTIVEGRRLRGRTFMVPMIVGSYDTDGSLTAGMVGFVQTAATALVTAYSSNLVVWSRPKKDPDDPETIIRPGSHGIVTGAQAIDKVAVLRSRRD